MYTLLIRLMAIAALTQLGITLASFTRIEKASRDVLRVDWKPISVFPGETKRFR